MNRYVASRDGTLRRYALMIQSLLVYWHVASSRPASPLTLRLLGQGGGGVEAAARAQGRPCRGEPPKPAVTENYTSVLTKFLLELARHASLHVVLPVRTSPTTYVIKIK